MATMLDIANKLADPKYRAACERIVAHPNAIEEAKGTARAILKLMDAEAERRRRIAQAKPQTD